MERLTRKDFDMEVNTTGVLKTGTTLYRALEKLREYENAEEQGLIVKLPCKVGDKLYYLREQYKEINGDVYSIECAIIDKISIARSGTALYGQQKKGSIDFMCYADDIGKTIFLTEAEALQALKER